MDPNSLPAVTRWAQSKGAEPDYIRFVGETIGPQAFYASAHFIWPAFIERHGCIFLQWKYDEQNVGQWLEQLEGDLRAVEKVINHVHLWDVFTEIDLESQVIPEIGRLLQRTWSFAAVSSDVSFPVRVDYIDNEEEYGPTLILYGVR
jgi:hypothetical protein